MKSIIFIALLLATTTINCEDQKPKSFKLSISSTNLNSATNKVNGRDVPTPTTERFVYQYFPQPQQPMYAQSSAPTYLYRQSLQESPLMMTAIPVATNRTPEMQTPLTTSNTTPPSWQMPSIGELIVSIKNTACTINPYTITAGALIALYATYLVKAYNTAFQVMKKNTWATWKEHIPVEVMVEIPHLEVAEELFNAIKAKYLPLNSADLMTPIVKFNNAVDKELVQLNYFIRLHEWLNYTKLGYIFPKQEIEITHAHTKIKRLVFLKDVLLAWTSDYSSAIMHDKYIPRCQHQATQQVVNEPNIIDEATTLECL